MQLRVERVAELDVGVLAPLVAVSRAEGHAFVERLRREWEDGRNRFAADGEALFLARHAWALVGVCGLNVDPYAGDPRVGRLRHLYVLPDWRRRGVARGLVERCLAHAAGRFERVRLRTDSPEASRFYVAVGFPRVDEPDATHARALG